MVICGADIFITLSQKYGTPKITHCKSHVFPFSAHFYPTGSFQYSYLPYPQLKLIRFIYFSNKS